MEDLIIKYLENKCSPEEKLQVESNPEWMQEIAQINQVDAVFFGNMRIETDGAFRQKLLLNLMQPKSVSEQYKDFILPMLFVLGSVSYALFTHNSSVSSDGNNYIATIFTDYSHFILIGISCVFGFLALDKILEGRHKHPGINLVC
ncbi:MAG: hypothetical protein IPN29_10835 [Saprospiraceae bacterium]|nr:hypothetical protein [Saprospiraceae bacterium]